MSEPVAPTTPANPEGGVPSMMIPKARLDEVIGQREALKAQLDAINSEKEAARQEQLKAAGQFGEVEKELKAKLEAAEAEKARLAAIAEQFEAQQKATREATIAQLPESQREYASKLSPDLLPGFVAAIGGKTTPPPKIGEPGVNVANKLTPQQISDGVATGGRKWLLENAHLIE